MTSTMLANAWAKIHANTSTKAPQSWSDIIDDYHRIQAARSHQPLSRQSRKHVKNFVGKACGQLGLKDAFIRSDCHIETIFVQRRD